MVESPSTNKLILIAEDNQDLRIIFEMALASLPCDVMVATDGREALRIMDEHVPDLLVLDINMPFLSGLGVLRHIQQDSRFENTRVIVVSGNHLAVHEAEIAHVDLFLVKPVDIQDLRNFVRRFFRLGIPRTAEVAEGPEPRMASL